MRSMSNQRCKVRLVIMNLNSDEPSFYLYRILVSKYSGSCDSINDPYAKLCVPDVVKTINIKVFNLMSRANETKHVCWHKICKCKCRLGASVCNDKQNWNNDICRCECKELINKGRCNNGAIRFVQPPDPQDLTDSQDATYQERTSSKVLSCARTTFSKCFCFGGLALRSPIKTKSILFGFINE